MVCQAPSSTTIVTCGFMLLFLQGGQISSGETILKCKKEVEQGTRGKKDSKEQIIDENVWSGLHNITVSLISSSVKFGYVLVIRG